MVDQFESRIEQLQCIIDENNETIIELQEEIAMWQDKYYSLFNLIPYEIRILAKEEGIL